MADDRVKLTTEGDMAARIAKRLRPSNEQTTAQTKTQTGTGSSRTSHSIHLSGSQAKHGEEAE
jgi:hypothetical protein